MDVAFSQIEASLNPFDTYRTMRTEQPVYFDPQRGIWNVFQYADVMRVLSDYETFSSQFSQADSMNSSSAHEPFAASMISTDPPRHRQLRGLVTQAFTPRAVANLEPRIRQIVAEHLDQVQDQGEMDVIADLAYPLPVIVIAELLGIPSEDRERFKHWSDVVVSMADVGGNVDAQKFMQNQAVLEMGAYFMQMIEQRRQNPGDDLISGLLAAEVDGQKLEMIELLGFCVLLLVAGNETTTNLIGNAMATFADHPEDWQQLRQQPELLNKAIEEVLRYRSPVQSMFRVAKEDVTLHGQTIEAGQMVIAWIGSANHDAEQFEDPECFVANRSPNRHLAFGHGIHYCLGAPLARLEADIALGALLERFERFTIKPGAELERLPSLIVYGYKELPILFETAK